MSQENNYITDVDVGMLKERMANMHKELYGGYKEFSEVDMTLKQMYNTSIFKKMEDAREEGLAKGVAQGMAKGIAQGMEKVFALLEQGVSLAEAKKRLGLQ